MAKTEAGYGAVDTAGLVFFGALVGTLFGVLSGLEIHKGEMLTKEMVFDTAVTYGLGGMVVGAAFGAWRASWR